MSQFITGKEAQLLLGITTRQGLKKIVDKFNVEVKRGNGTPNLYKKTDIENYIKRKDDPTIAGKKKPRTVHKAKVIKKIVDTKKAVREEQLKNKPKPVKKTPPKKEPKEKIVEVEKEEPIQLPKLEDDKKLDSEDFNPLNAIGQAEFLRVEKLAKDNGTYQDLDQSLLLFYAISYQKYINAVVKSEQLDDVTMNEAGDLKVHPYFQIADKCFSHMSKCAATLGLGVRNRIGLELKKEKKKSMMDILAETEDF